MKKLAVLFLLLAFHTATYAQQTKVGRAADRVALKTKKVAKDVKEGTVKTANKVADKSKKVGKDVKEGTVKTANKVADKSKEVASDVKTGTKRTVAKIRESNEKAPATPDKVSGTYNGKTVYTGPRGGRYYINENGNKTYLSDDK